MNITPLSQALEQCSPDQRAYLSLELAREEQKRQQRSQFWERVEVGVTTGLVGLTLLTLLNSKLNQVSTNWYQALAGGAESEAIAIETEVETLPDELDTTPLKSGDMIGVFRVSRGTIAGEHEGVDVATPEGTPLFVFGQEGESITVNCETQTNASGSYEGWGIYGTFYIPSIDKSFLVGHLSECNAGTYQPGEVWGYSGNTGKSTGPHTHTEQFTGSKAGYTVLPEEPTRAYVEQIHGVFQ